MMTQRSSEVPSRIVVTGGPGAGKTAALELARRHFCRHVEVLPEAAGIVFSGGFPRRDSGPALRAVQRAIYHVQCELESIALSEEDLVVALCDRGTLDGLAYWPASPDDFLAELGTSMSEELSRYRAVIHLRVPTDATQYVGTTLRRETHAEALALDARLLEVWAKHPRRYVIDDTTNFLEKTSHVLAAITEVMGTHVCREAA